MYSLILIYFAKLAFFCNILNGDLYIDALITELFQMCLIVSHILGEGTLWNAFDGVMRRRLGRGGGGRASEECF